MCNDTLQRLCGTLDQNLHELSKQLHIRVARKPEAITVSGENADLGVFRVRLTRPLGLRHLFGAPQVRRPRIFGTDGARHAWCYLDALERCTSLVF